MTFNVRQMDGDDGEHAWPFRKKALVETLRNYRPMLLGTQEIFREQADFILEKLPCYNSFGSGRFGDDRDKHNLIFYRREFLSVLEAGDFWLSNTPAVPGSADWGIPRPRLITWGLLQLADGPKFLALNTHFPYGSGADQARQQSARLLNRKLLEFDSSLPAIVTGDFNAGVDSDVYRVLTENLQDARLLAHRRVGPEGTIHGFGKVEGPRIDWILKRSGGSVDSAETITGRIDGLFPSDHYPVQVSLSL